MRGSPSVASPTSSAASHCVGASNPAVNATVTGNTWQYSLTPAQIDAMGQGTELLTVTQTDTQGVASSSSREITVDTVAPVLTPIHVFVFSGSRYNLDYHQRVGTGVFFQPLQFSVHYEPGVTISARIGGTSATEGGIFFTLPSDIGFVPSSRYPGFLSSLYIFPDALLQALTLQAVEGKFMRVDMIYTDEAGNQSFTVNDNLFFDLTAPTGLVVNPIAGDNIISASERASG